MGWVVAKPTLNKVKAFNGILNNYLFLLCSSEWLNKIIQLFYIFFVFQLFFSSFFPLMLRKFQVSEILKGSMRDFNPLLEHTIWRFKKVWRSEVFGLTFEWLMLLQALSMLQDTEKLLCDITSQWENDNSWYGDCRSPWRQSAIKCLF